MIAKIKSGAKFYGAALYNQKKVDTGQAKVLYHNGFLNTKPKTVADTLQFLSGKRVKKPVFHASLSFPKADGDKLDDEKMLQIAKAYLAKMGYENQPVIIYRHFDTKHPHVHILTSRVGVKTQLKIKDQMEGRRSKEITDQFERKYNLVVADQQKAGQKTVVRDVQKALETGKPEDLKFLNKALEKLGSEMRVQAVGKGMIYYKLDADGKRDSRSYKSSLFKESGLDLKQLNATFQANRTDRIYVKNAVGEVLQGTEKISMERFAERLKSRNIDAVFREGSKGYLGVNYVYKQHTYKGSDLERSLSWNQVKQQIDLPSAADYGLKKQLVDSLKSGERIRMEIENGEVKFGSKPPELAEQLNGMEQGEALKLAGKHNDYQATIRQREGQFNGPSLEHAVDKLVRDFGGDVDEFLNKRKQKKMEDGRRLRR